METRTAAIVSSPVQVPLSGRGTVYFIPKRLCPIDGMTDKELSEFESQIGDISYTLRQLDAPPAKIAEESSMRVKKRVPKNKKKPVK